MIQEFDAKTGQKRGLIYWVALVFSSCILVICWGCSRQGSPGPLVGNSLSTEVAKEFVPQKMNAVVVFPWESSVSYPNTEEIAQELDSLLKVSLRRHSTLVLINDASPEQVAEVIDAARRRPEPLRSRALAAGKNLDADGVLYGVVSRYTVSDGSRLGASKPAAVAFKLWLVATDTGKVVWSATYENREQPLSDNLFRVGQAFRDGVGYRSSKQLIGEGFSQAAIELEKLRRPLELR